MGVYDLLSVAAAIVILVLTIHTYGAASASGHGRFGFTDGDQEVNNGVTGLCSASMIVHAGYKCQEFNVTTDDGYILSMQRFPDGRNGGGGSVVESKKQPVLLQHGLFVDGMSWMLNSANESLALILADNGYDVWIANTRGTRFSRRHLSLDPADKEYWDWTWDDLVTYELSATINFVFNQTGQMLHYVGHSLGTLTALAGFSERKEVEKVKSAALLSPIAYVSHMTTALGNLAAKTFVGEITHLMGIAEFSPIGELVSIFLKAMCENPGIDCYDLLTALTGKNCCLNSSTVDTFLKNEPQSTSTKNLVHLAQTVRHGKLAKYNYINSNMEHYGEDMPPVYNLSNIPKTLPLFLSYGGNDALSDVKDVQILLDKLKLHDLNKLHVQFIQDFAHLDFIMGVTANNIVYNKVMAFFRDQ